VRRPLVTERQRHAEAPLIGAGVGLAPEELLGRHVGRGSRHGAEHRIGGQARAHERRRVPAQRVDLRAELELQQRPCVVDARDAEVEHEHAAVVAQHHVVGLEVAVHEPLGVGASQARARGLEHREDLCPRALRQGEPPLERDPVDELHHDEREPLDLADLVDLRDVGVGEPGHGLGLAHEPALTLVAPLPPQLDGDLAIELLVVRGVHHPRPAAAEPVEQHVVQQPRGPRDPIEQVVGQPLHSRRGRRGLRGRLGASLRVADRRLRCEGVFVHDRGEASPARARGFEASSRARRGASHGAASKPARLIVPWHRGCDPRVRAIEAR
jgi:hypothetical protein